MKKRIFIFAALVLMLGLAACGGGQENTGNAENRESAPPASNEQEPEKTDDAAQPTGDAAPTDNPSTTEPDEPEPAPESPDGSAADDPAKNRPETKTDTIELEGNKEEFQFTLHDSPDLGFSTYIVDDLLAEEASSGEGNAMLVYANFAGQLNEAAKVELFSPSASTTVEEQVESAKEVVKSNGFEVKERAGDLPNRFEWSEVEFDIAGQDGGEQSLLGTVSVFQHGDRVYRVIVQYPETYEEGFIPRIDKMFKDIVWYETP